MDTFTQDPSSTTPVTKSNLSVERLQCAKITTIFFDLDNTLIPTRGGDVKACRKLAELLETQYGVAKDEASCITQKFLKAFRHCPDNSQTSLNSWRTYLWQEALPKNRKHLAAVIFTQWLELRYQYLALSAEFADMLKRLRECNYKLAIITNGPSNAQWEKIHKINIRHYFDCILVSSDLPWEKPNPDIFYAACKFLNVKPQECAMIGDKLETDIEGGCLAGLGATFWLSLVKRTNFDALDDCRHKPTFILRNLLDIYKYFNISISQGQSKQQQIKRVPVPVPNRTNTNHRRSSMPSMGYNCNNDVDNSSDSIN